jgi:ankyrin repeat protein
MNFQHGYYVAVLLLLVLSKCRSVDIFEEVAKNSMEGIKAALKADDASINARGPGDQTPLMHAVLTGKVTAVKYLLRKGADVTIGEKDGYTPMHGAGFQGRAKIGQMLISHGLDPRDKHSDGYEPIQRACWGQEARHTETVRMFLDNGVWPNARTRKLISDFAEVMQQQQDL